MIAVARRTSNTVATIPELAAACGVSKATAYRWRKNPDIPGGADGPWDPQVVAEWALAKRSRNADRTAGIGTGHVHDPLRDARVLRERLAAQRDELQLQKMQGKTIDRDEVVPLLVKRSRAYKKALLAIGRRLARRLVNKSDWREIQELIDEEHQRALAIWSRAPVELDEEER